MTENFWSVIARTNAHLYSLLALLFLLVAVLWLLRPVDSGLIEIESGNGSQPDAATMNPLDEAVYPAEIDPVALNTSRNPFDSEYLQQVNQQLRWAEEVAAAAGSKTESEDPPTENTTQKKANAEASSQKPPKPVPPRVLRIVYRGMISNLDGSTQALVQDLESGVGRYYPAGADIEWAKLLAFSRGAMRISAAGEEYMLRRGVPFQLEESKPNESE